MSSNISRKNGLKKRTVIVASAMVVTGVGLFSGLNIAPASAMDGSTTGAPAMSQTMANGQMYTASATNFRVTLNNLLREHVTTSLDATRAIVRNNNQADINAAIASQYANSDALTGGITRVYGDAAGQQFSTLFREHIYKSNEYAMASAHGDTSGKQAAFAELQTYLHQIAAFFSGAIPGLQEQDAYGMLNEHEELINKATDAYAAGDYVQSYQMEREALKQISGAADSLSGGIVATQPTKFQ